MWKYIFSLLLLSALSASAQTDEEILEDLLLQDTLPKFRLQSATVNYNIFRMAENLLDKPRTSQEIQGEVSIYKLLLVADFGSESTERPGYQMEGTYWRAGVDVNLSAAWNEGQMIGLGLRIAQSRFSDQAQLTRTLVDASELSVNLRNDNMKARWAELVFKIRGKLAGNLYTGYTMRYQFFRNIHPYPEELRPFDVPGYGKTRRPNSFQFDFYMGYKFKFR